MGTNRLTSQQIAGKRFHVVGIGQRPTCRWTVERDTEAHIARSCHGGNRAKSCRDFLRQVIRAMMTAEQRHDGRTVFGNRDDRRLRCLVGQAWRQQTDQDPRGTDADNRCTGRKQGAQMIAGIVEGDLCGVHAARKAVNLGIRQHRHNLMRKVEPAGAENNNRRTHHFQTSSRLWTRIIEK